MCPSLLAACLTITAVGDVRITPRLLDHPRELAALHLEGDLVFANFEGVLSDQPDPDPWHFRVPTSSIATLKALGINALSLANNHSLDAGPGAFADSARILAKHFTVAPAVTTIAGRRIRLLAFSFAGSNEVNHPERLASIIGPKGHDVVIVSAHMGGENHLAARIPFALEFFGPEPRGNVVEFSHRAIDAGADLVLGHSPHVPRGIELYRGKLIVYSLGNFLFDYPGATLNHHAPGYSISIELDGQANFQSARIVSYDLQQGLPVPDPDQRAYKMVRYLTSGNLHSTNLNFPGEGRILKCVN